MTGHYSFLQNWRLENSTTVANHLFSNTLIKNTMQSQNSLLIGNEARIKKLHTERALQVRRDGIQVTLRVSQVPHHLVLFFNYNDTSRLQALLNQAKYGLELCLQNGHALVKFFSNQIAEFTSQYIMAYLPIDISQIDFSYGFFLMKSNASNSIHKAVLHNASGSAIADYIQEKTDQIEPPQSIIEFPYQQDLNQSQNEAIRKVGLHSLVFIKGPPGCGKTKTIGRLCKLLYQAKQKIMAGAVSNTGNLSILKSIVQEIISTDSQGWIKSFVNNMYIDRRQALAIQEAEKLYPRIVMLTPTQSRVQNDEIDPILRYFSQYNWVIRKMFLLNYDEDLSLDDLAHCLDLINSKSLNQSGLLKKVFSLYKQALKKIVQEAHIIISTTVLSKNIMGSFFPDVAIIDEASQATWADTYCYLNNNIKRMVQVGDDKQLDPTVISQDKLLKETVFSKLCHKNPQYFVMLDTQYRMHPEISQFPNNYFYQGKLKNGVSDLDRANHIQYFKRSPVSFVNHRVYQQYIEEQEKGKKNYYNLEEIRIIEQFLALFPPQMLENIGIISPYSLQVKMISQKFENHIKYYGLTVKSCDGYQGGEKDFIIFSCVRSNPQKKIGFCGQKNRINVSLTRARRALLIIGNVETLAFCSELPQDENVWHALISDLFVRGRVYQAGAEFYKQQQVISQPFAISYQFQVFNQPNQNNPEPVNADISIQNSNQSQHEPVTQTKTVNQVGYSSESNSDDQSDKLSAANTSMEYETEEIKYLSEIGPLIISSTCDQYEDLFNKNKIAVKIIRKRIQKALNQPNKTTLEGLRVQLEETIAKSMDASVNVYEKITQKLHQQALQLAIIEKQNTEQAARDAFCKQILQALTAKKNSNHIQQMQGCKKLLWKGVIHYLIKTIL